MGIVLQAQAKCNGRLQAGPVRGIIGLPLVMAEYLC
jgi:hypothetical protein